MDASTANELWPIPGRDLVPPPKLTRDAPRLDVFEPLKIGFFPALWNEARLAFAHSNERWLCQGLGVHIPLLGEPRLDNYTRAVPLRDHMRVRLDFVEEATRLHHLDDAHACVFARQS